MVELSLSLAAVFLCETMRLLVETFLVRATTRNEQQLLLAVFRCKLVQQMLQPSAPGLASNGLTARQVSPRLDQLRLWRPSVLGRQKCLACRE